MISAFRYRIPVLFRKWNRTGVSGTTDCIDISRRVNFCIEALSGVNFSLDYWTAIGLKLDIYGLTAIIIRYEVEATFLILPFRAVLHVR